MDMLDIYSLGNAYKAAPQKPANLVDILPEQLPAEESEQFSSVLDAAMGLVKETNALQNARQNEVIRFELGLSDNTHDLMIAQQKAAVALQYTTAVRDRFIEGYNTIMNMQI